MDEHTLPWVYRCTSPKLKDSSDYAAMPFFHGKISLNLLGGLLHYVSGERTPLRDESTGEMSTEKYWMLETVYDVFPDDTSINDTSIKYVTRFPRDDLIRLSRQEIAEVIETRPNLSPSMNKKLVDLLFD